MSRYAAMFERLGDEGAFGAFFMLGDPDLETSARLLDDLVAGGADMIEVGIPFSDPVADGPVIQAAAQRALAAGVRVSDCLDLMAGFRSRPPDAPVGILTYANIVMARAGFIREAAEAGADSLLIADVPALEAERYARDMKQAGIEPVLIAAANTPDATLKRVAELSSAYTYCVSRA
jgi:tryptophan synthase alpha chain